LAENKTKQTEASVEAYLAAIADEIRRKDCIALAKLMARASKEKPKMWGASIVGFGSYHYKYESGREGDSCITGFSARKGDISVYLMGDFPQRAELLAKLGRHKTGKACLYLRKLGDVDLDVLEQLVAASVAERRRRQG
jgi:nucleoid DNA-binding protein